MDVRFRNGGDGGRDAIMHLPRRRRGAKFRRECKAQELRAEVLDDAVADGSEGLDQRWFFFFE
jgi:hypothetical protein